MKIITNHHWHPFKHVSEVPVKVLEEDFDWLPRYENDYFIHYRGSWYHLSEFMRVPPDAKDMAGWHGHHSDSFFSGILIRVCEDGERYQIATCIG